MLKKTIASAVLFGVCCAPAVGLAQRNDYQHDQQYDHQNDHRYDHHDDHQWDHHDRYVRHREWRRGYHMRHDDWERGQRIDYRYYHLRQPPRGYEWREVDGNFVMAAVATGVIASIIAANAAH